MSAIKKELDELGVNYAGLLEKSEFVDLLVDARVRGDTASTTRSSGSGSDTSSGGGGGGGSGTTNSDFDPSYKNVEVGRKIHTVKTPLLFFAVLWSKAIE